MSFPSFTTKLVGEFNIKLFSLILVVLSVLIVLPTPALAFNQQINYQGKLTTSANAAVPDGSYSIVFSLYTTSSGGSNLWTETQTVSVTNGLFSVMLGSVTPLTSVNFNQNLYLGVKVGTDAEMTPRKTLGAVPAAFEAKKLDGYTTADFFKNASTTDDLTQGSTNKFYSTMLFASSLAGTTTDALIEGTNNLYYTNTRVNALINASSTIAKGSCATNEVLKWSGTNWICAIDLTSSGGGGSSLWATSTSDATVWYPELNASDAVVIGGSATSSLGLKLEVTGATKLSGNLWVTGNASMTSATMTAATSTSFYASVFRAITGTVTNLLATNSIITNGTTTSATSTNLYISNSVGIGTPVNSSPGSILHLYTSGGGITNDGLSSQLTIENGNTGVGNMATILFTTHEGSQSRRAQIASGMDSAGGHSGMLSFVLRKADDSFFEALHLSSTGNIGIGTSTPQRKLSVAGDMFLADAFYDSLYNSGTNGMVLQTTGSATKWVSTSSLNIAASAAGSTGQLQFNNSGALGASSNLYWDNSNKILGIATATQNGTLNANYINRAIDQINGVNTYISLGAGGYTRNYRGGNTYISVGESDGSDNDRAGTGGNVYIANGGDKTDYTSYTGGHAGSVTLVAGGSGEPYGNDGIVYIGNPSGQKNASLRIYGSATTTALNVWGTASTTNLRVANSIGIGSSTPNSLLTIGTPTNTTTDFFRIGTSTNQNILLVDKNGNVGIGSTPQASFKVTVSGAMYVTGDLSIGGSLSLSSIDAATASFTNTTSDILGVGTTSAIAQFAASSTDLIAGLFDQRGTEDILQLQDAGANVLVVKDGGNVGIGTNTPTSRLHVKSSSNTSGLVTGIASDSNYTIFSLGQNGNGVGNFSLRRSNTNVISLDAGNVSYLNSGYSFGIGTTTPRFSLTVASSSSAQLSLSDSSLTSNAWTFRSAGNYLFIATSSPSTFATSSTAALTIDPNGNISISSLTIANLTGILQAKNGLVSSSSTLSVTYGGTGLSTPPAYGQLLVGNSTGGYTLTATSALGISSSAAGSTGQIQYNNGGVLGASSNFTYSGGSMVMQNNLKGYLNTALSMTDKISTYISSGYNLSSSLEYTPAGTGGTVYLAMGGTLMGTDQDHAMGGPGGTVNLAWGGDINLAQGSGTIGPDGIVNVGRYDGLRNASLVVYGSATTTALKIFGTASTTNLVINGTYTDSLNSVGTNGMVLQTTGTGTKWVATSSLNIAAAAAGSAGEIQFNSSGVMAATTNLFWNNTYKIFSVGSTTETGYIFSRYLNSGNVSGFLATSTYLSAGYSGDGDGGTGANSYISTGGNHSSGYENGTYYGGNAGNVFLANGGDAMPGNSSNGHGGDGGVIQMAWGGNSTLDSSGYGDYPGTYGEDGTVYLGRFTGGKKNASLWISGSATTTALNVLGVASTTNLKVSATTTIGSHLVMRGDIATTTDIIIDAVTGAKLTLGGTWTNASDRRLKENFTLLDPDQVLSKIISLSVTKWNYIAEGSNITHIGPVAQDFYDTFGLGGSDTSISTIDPAGVALVGIKALETRSRSQQQAIDYLQAHLNIVTTATSSDLGYATSSDVFASTSAQFADETTGAIDTLITRLIANFKIVQEFLANRIVATVGLFDRVKTKWFETDNAKINNGIEMKDASTGESYCVKIVNGDWQKVKGTCDTNNTQVIVSTPSASNIIPVEETTSASTTTATTTPETETASSTPVIENPSTNTPVVDQPVVEAPAPTPSLENSTPAPESTPTP